jgi:ABC-type Zn uptake system ZnuABC Zn-binding protein ZnuA
MPEGIELPEAHHDHEDNPLVLPVSITMSILAVLIASATLLSHRAHTEELLLQSQATDQWAYYQAKNGRYHGMVNTAEVIATIVPQDKEKAEAILKKYEKEIERYDRDKEDISEKAKELEKERDLVSRRADRYDGGEAFLEIGLVICSITMLTKRKGFWFAGILLGAGGIVLAVTGIFLR